MDRRAPEPSGEPCRRIAVGKISWPNDPSQEERTMRVNLSGHHVDVTPALRSYVERKLARVLRCSERVIEVQCTLTVDKLRHRAESTVYVRGLAIHASAVSEDMYAAIDALSDKLTRRVRKRKERVNEHRAPLARRHELAAAL